ncbi:MAG: dockerin type I domain-containing protein [Acidobacteriota bacterium]
MKRYFQLKKFIILGISGLLLSCFSLFAGDVSLAWDPSISSSVVGYKLYYGNASGSYDSFHTITNQSSYTVTDLVADTYFFAVTAFDSMGNESGFSNEVSAIVANSTTTCDINSDSSVNAIDIQAMVNIVLGIISSGNENDLNSDGRIDVLDLQILNNVILGLRDCP